jgi:hypothetical protein
MPLLLLVGDLESLPADRRVAALENILEALLEKLNG